MQSTPTAKRQTRYDADYLASIGVPEAIFADLMTGQPMIVKRMNERWRVYSVGTNKTDDGGEDIFRADPGLN